MKGKLISMFRKILVTILFSSFLEIVSQDAFYFHFLSLRYVIAVGMESGKIAIYTWLNNWSLVLNVSQAYPFHRKIQALDW